MFSKRLRFPHLQLPLNFVTPFSSHDENRQSFAIRHAYFNKVLREVGEVRRQHVAQVYKRNLLK